MDSERHKVRFHKDLALAVPAYTKHDAKGAKTDQSPQESLMSALKSILLKVLDSEESPKDLIAKALQKDEEGFYGLKPSFEDLAKAPKPDGESGEQQLADEAAKKLEQLDLKDRKSVV